MPPPLALTRPWPEDAEAIASALADWDTVRWLTTLPWPYGLPDASDFIDVAGLDEHAIRLGDRLVGMVQAGRVFGIWIAPDRQGRGLGRRAGVLALSRLFLSGVPGVQAHVLIGNDRSARLLDWLGFQPQGRVTLQSRPLGRPVAATAMHLDRATFEARHAIALTTDRLVIDAIVPADLPALHRIVTQPQVARMMQRFRPDMDLDEAASVLSDSGLLLPLRLAVRHQGQVIGAVGLSAATPPRLHYFLDPQMAGQGLGQEMVAAVFHELVARFAPTEMVADVFLDNPASRKILKNLGFRRAEDIALYTPGRDAQADAALYRWRPGLLP
ncbi:GNAT family N-acetyltransferase [Paracoccus nototheniae]|uniref:GNAT family N-acetyltransferase n=1 Tax=Paracoccus nototheniae TaxID=2489002 RepID=A0ABW4DT30_9RHOB|nr:GNAT family N-acetyltransferase [Paracoccus nototheniae]